MRAPRSAAGLLARLALLATIAAPARAQVPVLLDGVQHAPGVHWKQIETEHYQVIFPEELTAEAQRAARLAERAHDAVGKTLGLSARRIPLLLTNQTTEANGSLSFTPRRTEWYGTPPASGLLGTNDWYGLLAVHELRHVAQFDRANSGFTRVAGYAFGELGSLALTVLSTPGWFIEGDAVGSETALTSGGRGRMPQFDMEIRALLLDGIRYPYAKAFLNSYRDWYPSVYNLGYLLTTYVRRHDGGDVWDRVLGRAARQSYNPFAFSRALQRETGHNAEQTYAAAMDELQALWRQQLRGLVLSDARQVSPLLAAGWQTYEQPQYAADGSLVAQWYSRDRPYTLVRFLPDGRRETLGLVDAFNSPIGVGGMRVAWTRTVPDPRWGRRDWSDVMVRDLESGHTRRITGHGHFFSAVPSPDGRRIAAVEFTPERTAALVVLDAESGRALQRIPAAPGDFLRSPAWSADGRSLVLTAQDLRGKALALADLQSGTLRDLTPRGTEDYAFPRLAGGYVVYSSPCSGIDNIYALQLSSGRRFQLTSRRLAALNGDVSPDGRTLAFADYTVHGTAIATMPFDPASWTPIEAVEDRSIQYWAPLVAQEQGHDILRPEAPIAGAVAKAAPPAALEVRDYSPLAHALHVHSWGVLPGTDPGQASLDVYSADVLGTSALYAGYAYNFNESQSSVHAGGSYAAFHPIIDFAASYGGRGSTYTDTAGRSVGYHWRESALDLGLRAPINLSRGFYATHVQLGVGLGLRQVQDASHLEPFDYGDGRFLPVAYALDFSRGRGWANDFDPVWGQALRVRYRHTPLRGDYHGRQLDVLARLWMPGIAPHHAIELSGGLERQQPDNYRFASELVMPRGYSYRYDDRVTTGSLAYALPLAYPDLVLGSLAYVKRLRGRAFFDYGVGTTGGVDRFYRSVGGELIADTDFLMLPADVGVGVRWAHRIDARDERVQLIVGLGGI